MELLLRFVVEMVPISLRGPCLFIYLSVGGFVINLLVVELSSYDSSASEFWSSIYTLKVSADKESRSQRNKCVETLFTFSFLKRNLNYLFTYKKLSHNNKVFS